MRIERTHDMGLVRAIVTNPDVLPGCDDERYQASNFYWPAADHPRAIWLAVWEGAQIMGLFFFHPVGPVLSWRENALQLEAHTMFLPGARGRGALKAYRLALDWIWNNTRVQRVIGCTPEDNRAAVRMAVWAGMTRFGERTKAYRRGGRWVDGILTMIERSVVHGGKRINQHMEVA